MMYQKSVLLILIRIGIYKITENTLTFGILKKNFEEWDQKLVATISTVSVMMHASMDRLYLKNVNEIMTDVKQILFDEVIVESEILFLKSMDYKTEKAGSGNTSDRPRGRHE